MGHAHFDLFLQKGNIVGLFAIEQGSVDCQSGPLSTVYTALRKLFDWNWLL